MRLQGANACEERVRQRNSDQRTLYSSTDSFQTHASKLVVFLSFLSDSHRFEDLSQSLGQQSSNYCCCYYSVRSSIDLTNRPAKILPPPSTLADLVHPHSISQHLSVHSLIYSLPPTGTIESRLYRNTPCCPSSCVIHCAHDRQQPSHIICTQSRRLHNPNLETS